MSTSTYITLADVKQLVIDRQDVLIVDAKTGENLTRSILLQVILEEEVGGTPIFSETVLANLIRFYGHTMQGFMGAYMEKNIQAMAEMQSQWAEQTRQMPPELWGQFQAFSQPVMPPTIAPTIPPTLEAYTEQSRQTFAKAQEQMQEQVRQQTEQFLQLFGIKSNK